jgi:hypothetical protein
LTSALGGETRRVRVWNPQLQQSHALLAHIRAMTLHSLSLAVSPTLNRSRLSPLLCRRLHVKKDNMKWLPDHIQSYPQVTRPISRFQGGRCMPEATVNLASSVPHAGAAS